MEQKGSARASGEETFTDEHSTEGGGVSATSFASSTGQGAPQQHEATTLHSTPGGAVPRASSAAGGPAGCRRQLLGVLCANHSQHPPPCGLLLPAMPLQTLSTWARTT